MWILYFLLHRYSFFKNMNETNIDSDEAPVTALRINMMPPKFRLHRDVIFTLEDLFGLFLNAFFTVNCIKEYIIIINGFKVHGFVETGVFFVLSIYYYIVLNSIFIFYANKRNFSFHLCGLYVFFVFPGKKLHENCHRIDTI